MLYILACIVIAPVALMIAMIVALTVFNTVLGILCALKGR